MDIVAYTRHAMVRGTDRIYADEVSYSRKGEIAKTKTVSSGIFSLSAGENPIEVMVKGHFDPTEIMFITTFIRNFNSSSERLVIDGWELENPIMLEGEAVLKEDSRLGEFSFRFGGL